MVKLSLSELTSAQRHELYEALRDCKISSVFEDSGGSALHVIIYKTVSEPDKREYDVFPEIREIIMNYSDKLLAIDLIEVNTTMEVVDKLRTIKEPEAHV